MNRSLTLLTNLGLLTMLLAASGGAGGMHGSEKCSKEMEMTPDYDIFCPDPIMNGASCRSYGVLIAERESGLIFPGPGDLTVKLSDSHAWTWAIPGAWPPVPERQQGPMPPSDPNAHAHAKQVGFTYNNAGLLGGVALDTSTIFSRCDVVAREDPTMGLYTEAYGRAGVQDFELSLLGLGLAVGAETLDFELHAVGLPYTTYAMTACDIVQFGFTPGFTISYCEPPNSGIFAPPPLIVEVNEQWGPLLNPAGQWVYGGAALHITVDTGAAIVDIYVGYVTVAVTGGPPSPASWFMDPLIGPGPMPCYPAPCQP